MNSAEKRPGQKLDKQSQQDLAKVVHNAAQTIALVGFPNSGKTSYLAAMGKTLRSPQMTLQWRIVGASDDVFRNAQGLLNSQSRGQTWLATDPHVAPKPLDLFTAKRKGLLHWQTSAFDTSGEHYLAIAGGLELDESSDAAYFANTLRKEVLSRCPGVMALVDCSMAPDAIGEQVNLYCSLFNRIHGFKNTPSAQAADKAASKPTHRRRLPVAFAVTKVDELDGAEIRLRKEDCAYLKYLQSKGRPLGDAGIAGADSPIIGYRVKGAVFLDPQKHPDAAEAQAVLEDYVACRMRPLAEMIANMRLSEMYDVKLFPVSAWGKRLDSGQSGQKVRPGIEEIEPARVLDPMFWLMEKVHQTRMTTLAGRTLKVASLLAVLALLLGPGSYWGMYAASRVLLGRGSAESAGKAASLANHHPYVHCVQRWCQPRAQQMLADLDFSVASALMNQNHQEAALELIAQARDLNVDTQAIDDLEARLRQKEFDDVRGKTVPAAMLWNAARPLLTVQSRRGAKAFSQSVVDIGEALRSKRMDVRAWQEFGGQAMAKSAMLGSSSLRLVQGMLAESYLEQAKIASADSAGDLVAAMDLARKADAAARLTGDARLMGLCRTNLTDKGQALMKQYLVEAPGALDAGQVGPAMQAWDAALKVGQECPSLVEELRVGSGKFARKLCGFAGRLPAKDAAQAVRAYDCALQVFKDIDGHEAEVRETAGLDTLAVMTRMGQLAGVKSEQDESQELLRRIPLLWKEAQPAEAELAKRVTDSAVALLGEGKIDWKVVEGLKLGPAIAGELFKHYLDAKDAEQSLAALCVLLQEPGTLADDKIKQDKVKAVVTYVDRFETALLSPCRKEVVLAGRVGNLETARSLAVAIKGLEGESHLLGGLGVAAMLDWVDCISGDKANRSRVQELFQKAAALWKESQPVSEGVSKSVEARLAAFLKSQTIDRAGLDAFGCGSKVMLCIFQEMYDQDGGPDKALEFMGTCLAGPSALTPVDARECIQKIRRLTLRAFTETPMDSALLASRLAKIGECSRKVAMADVSRECDLLIAHLDRIRNMSLMKLGARTFYLDKTEVTVGEYRKFLAEVLAKEGKAKADELRPAYEAEPGSGKLAGIDDPAYAAAYTDPDQLAASPVVGVSYQQASRYAAWRGKRLPESAECKAVAAKLAQVPAEQINVNRRAGMKITPVTREFADIYQGVSGLAGNVREWCGATLGEGKARQAEVFGMSWFGSFQANWAEAVELLPADQQDHHTGFRCALDVLPAGVSVTPATTAPSTKPSGG